MSTPIRRSNLLRPVLAAALAFSALTAAHAGVQDRIYDFTDSYYRQNGVEPTLIAGRRTGTDGRSVFDTPNFSFQRNVRATRETGTYDSSGAIVFWNQMGDVGLDGFTHDAAGQNARTIANRHVLYVFPRRDQPDPVTLGANRQDDITDTSHGYFSDDPLGLWLHVWVHYTPKAFNTSDGVKALNDLARKNGLALDGTPIIETTSDVDNLFSKGFVDKRPRNPNGSEGTQYGICPVIKDPRNGGIAPDATLGIAVKPDGSPLDSSFLTNFLSLQRTGDWAK